jgi:hypothetical protein
LSGFSREGLALPANGSGLGRYEAAFKIFAEQPLRVEHPSTALNVPRALTLAAQGRQRLAFVVEELRRLAVADRAIQLDVRITREEKMLHNRLRLFIEAAPEDLDPNRASEISLDSFKSQAKKDSV